MLWQMLCLEFKDWYVHFVMYVFLLKGEGVTSVMLWEVFLFMSALF